jgi:hypothetical protein
VSGPRRGPALVYIDSAGTHHDIARTAIPDPVERDLCRALTTRADDLADKADTEPADKPRTGLYL